LHVDTGMCENDIVDNFIFGIFVCDNVRVEMSMFGNVKCDKCSFVNVVV